MFMLVSCDLQVILTAMASYDFWTCMVSYDFWKCMVSWLIHCFWCPDLYIVGEKHGVMWCVGGVELHGFLWLPQGGKLDGVLRLSWCEIAQCPVTYRWCGIAWCPVTQIVWNCIMSCDSGGVKVHGVSWLVGGVVSQCLVTRRWCGIACCPVTQVMWKCMVSCDLKVVWNCLLSCDSMVSCWLVGGVESQYLVTRRWFGIACCPVTPTRCPVTHRWCGIARSPVILGVVQSWAARACGCTWCNGTCVLSMQWYIKVVNGAVGQEFS